MRSRFQRSDCSDCRPRHYVMRMTNAARRPSGAVMRLVVLNSFNFRAAGSSQSLSAAAEGSPQVPTMPAL
jgi:hypothetical protein